MKQLIFLVFIVIAGAACSATEQQSNQQPPSHQLWDQLTSKFVQDNGMVDYKGFIQDSVKLNNYLSELSKHAPDPKTWTKEEQLTYWINAYNAFTVKLIIDNYPVESIKDLHPSFYIPGINTVWHKKFFKIGGKETSLDEIEHGILRKKFNEPRIHFAINCASISCPSLLQGAYFASSIDKQLDAVAIRFINDPQRNNIARQHAEISKIFNWFNSDFTKKGSLSEFLNQYSSIKLAQDAEIDYMDYNWSLNDANE